MITTRFYLGTRNINPNNPAPLKLTIYKNRVRALLPLNIRLDSDEWNATLQRTNNREIQSMINERKAFVEAFLFRME